jgi:Family of unknown function (DUF6492)
MRFAIVTPSYHVDFERCALLTASIRRHLPRDVQHCIIVDRHDRALFARLADDRTRLFDQEDLVGLRCWRLPFAKRWRMGWRLPPVRGWIWQQIVKLAIAHLVDADAYMVVDSDCLFLRAFDPRDLLVEGRVPLFREEKPWYATDADTRAWHRHAGRLLGVPRPASPYRTGYVGPHVWWRRDVLLQLGRRLGGETPAAWAWRVALCPTFSEYVTYGMFVEHVLGLEAAGHYAFDRELVWNHWVYSPLGDADLARFRDEVPADRVMVHINGKSRTPVASIARLFDLAPAG